MPVLKGCLLLSFLMTMKCLLPLQLVLSQATYLSLLPHVLMQICAILQKTWPNSFQSRLKKQRGVQREWPGILLAVADYFRHSGFIMLAP